MTQLLDKAKEPQARSDRTRVRDERAGRLPVVIALVVSLIGCGLTRQWAADWKLAHSDSQSSSGEHGALSGMNSYALALMLGGLRGPLVMVLWSKVESQKIDRDLEDVDSMIEWIRLLQPEFDTVHIFQIWNKAYNISVMMASTASKYTTILDAIEYARRVEADRPGDININDELAQVYADKLGGKNVTERSFYRKQFRQDTLTDENRQRAYPEDRLTYRRLGVKYLSPRNGPLLDAHNNILSPLLLARYPRPANMRAGSEWNDGSELQYLREYQPFPYGIAPTAMGYNYAKRAQVAMTVGGQRPLQVSDTVVDSRPGLILKQWAEEEADRGITYEGLAFGKLAAAEAETLEPLTAGVATTQKPLDEHALDVAIYSYDLSTRLCTDALKEYERHLANTQFVNPYQTYTSQLDELKTMRLLSTADHAYLMAIRGGPERDKYLDLASQSYARARTMYQLIVLKYFTEGPIVDAVYHGVELDKLTPDEVDRIYRQMLQAVKTSKLEFHEYDDRRSDYGVYIDRADTRLRLLANQPKSVLQLH